MTFEEMTRQMDQGHPTGELCPGCDRDIVISTVGPIVVLDCDCGSVSALAPEKPAHLSPAA